MGGCGGDSRERCGRAATGVFTHAVLRVEVFGDGDGHQRPASRTRQRKFGGRGTKSRPPCSCAPGALRAAQTIRRTALKPGALARKPGAPLESLGVASVPLERSRPGATRYEQHAHDPARDVRVTARRVPRRHEAPPVRAQPGPRNGFRLGVGTRTRGKLGLGAERERDRSPNGPARRIARVIRRDELVPARARGEFAVAQASDAVSRTRFVSSGVKTSARATVEAELSRAPSDAPRERRDRAVRDLRRERRGHARRDVVERRTGRSGRPTVQIRGAASCARSRRNATRAASPVTVGASTGSRAPASRQKLPTIAHVPGGKAATGPDCATFDSTTTRPSAVRSATAKRRAPLAEHRGSAWPRRACRPTSQQAGLRVDPAPDVVREHGRGGLGGESIRAAVSRGQTQPPDRRERRSRTGHRPHVVRKIVPRRARPPGWRELARRDRGRTSRAVRAPCLLRRTTVSVSDVSPGAKFAGR